MVQAPRLAPLVGVGEGGQRRVDIVPRTKMPRNARILRCNEGYLAQNLQRAGADIFQVADWSSYDGEDAHGKCGFHPIIGARQTRSLAENRYARCQVAIGVTLLPVNGYLLVFKHIDDAMGSHAFLEPHGFDALISMCSLKKPQEQSGCLDIARILRSVSKYRIGIT